MSDTLKALLAKWDLETVLFKMKSEEHMVAVKNLCQLNDMINEQIKKEGLTLKDCGRL